jgi:hypothetical protein
VYVISLDEEFNSELKVVQPESKSDLELRIEALEIEVFKASKLKNEMGPLRFELRTSAV